MRKTTPKEGGPDYLGLGSGLSEGPAPEMIEAGFALECADAAILHDGFGLADLAQALVLAEASILPDAQIAPLLGALLQMSRIRADEFPYDANLGDAWNSWHHELTRRVGAAASWLTVGRPRREAGRVAFRIALRQGILQAHHSLTGLGESLLAQAQRYRTMTMADYTYLQPAQPTTFGYLLLGHLYPVLRDTTRLQHNFDWVNLSPAGAGGTAGGSLPVDRGRLANLLGFDGVALHARDAMWQTDGLVELLAVLAGAATHASQIASDLEVFASPPFGFIELSDAYSRASALMPQKKNPYSLAVVRGTAGVLAGRLSGILSVLRTGTARTDHFVFAYGEVPRAISRFTASESLLAGTIRTLRVRERALATSAREGFLGAADLAEALVLARALSHDVAYKLIGAAVRHAQAEGRKEISTLDLTQAAGQLGITIGIDERQLTLLTHRANDPEAMIALRTIAGGAASKPFTAMLQGCRASLRRATTWREQATARLREAEQRLSGLAEARVKSHRPVPAREPQ